MKHAANRALRRALFAAGRTRVFWPLLRSRATIFMLHRFQSPEIGVEGLDPETLRRSLAALRRERFELLPLATLLEDLAAGCQHRAPAVAFTIDDGYLDHATVAAPVFAEFDCPVTTFVTTGFLDGRLWFWWDRIEYIFDHTPLRSVSVQLGDRALSYSWIDGIERNRAQLHFTTSCKTVADEKKLAAIRELARVAEVNVPVAPPLRYAPMTWADLRRCEQMTMSFGPHTVTHPILSRTSDTQSRMELTESWDRLRMEASRPVAVGCYPNGQANDFSDRETNVLRDLGFVGAVTGMVGYADAPAMRSGELERFRVPRFAYSNSADDILLVAGGAERLKQIVRRER